MIRGCPTSALLILAYQIGCFLFCGLFGTAFSYTKWLPFNLKVLIFNFPVKSADPERALTRSHTVLLLPSAHCARCAVALRQYLVPTWILCTFFICAMHILIHIHIQTSFIHSLFPSIYRQDLSGPPFFVCTEKKTKKKLYATPPPNA
jgi:hypothetical protein